MKSIRAVEGFVASCIKNLRRFRPVPTACFHRSQRLVRMPRYQFGTGKSNFPQDFSKNKVQGMQRGEQYQSIQMKTGCLGLFSYIITSGGEAAIIDPLNQTEQYIRILRERNLKLKYIFMTHFHADFISGQTDLLKVYPDTKIIMGPNAKTEAYKIQILNDGESLKVGNVWIQALHTPGHTMESTCYILKTSDGHKQALYTGDTVFISEVGRPDLAAKAKIKPEQLAKHLYKSIQKIKALPDELTIYPTHGQGSSCGKNIQKGDKTTIGCQKQKNYAFKAQTQEDFVQKVLKDMPKPPNYYFNSVEINKTDPFNFEQTFRKVFKPLTPEQFQEQMKKPNTVVLDVRTGNKQFYHGMIKGSYYVGSGGPLANYAGALFKPTDNFLIFGNEGQQQEATKRLLRIGYQNIKGYNDFDFDEWKGETIRYPQGTFEDLKDVNLGRSDYTILDLRTKPELEKEGVFMGKNVHEPIQTLEQAIRKNELDRGQKYLAHCASGYRSKIAATMLQKGGYDFKVLADAWKQYKQKGASVVPKP